MPAETFARLGVLGDFLWAGDCYDEFLQGEGI